MNIAKSDAQAQFGTHVENLTGSGKTINMHNITVSETNADEVRLRNEAKLEEAKSNLQNLKAQSLQQQGQQNQQQGQQNQTEGLIMIASASAIAGTVFGAPAAAGLMAAGVALQQMGQGQQNTAQGQFAQVPPSQQAATTHQNVSNQKNAQADAIAATQPVEEPEGQEAEGNGNPADGTYAAITQDDETAIGVDGEFGDDGTIGAGSVTEEEVTLLEELGGSSEELQNLMSEIETNASPEDLALYNEIFEDQSPEDIALITNDFINSDYAEGLNSENYIENFLDYALGLDDTERPNPNETSEIEATVINGDVDETNSVSNVDGEGVDPTIKDVGNENNTNRYGTVNLDGLGEVRSLVHGSNEGE